MQIKQIHPWFRNSFHLGSLLSLVAGIQLFIFSEQTDIYFAWTIQSSLTAATMGGFYFGTMTFGYLAARQTDWARVRGPAVGLFLFLCGTLAATFLHLDKFHFASENPITRSATWVWLAIYVLLPLVLGMSFFLQYRIRADDHGKVSILPAWVRVILAAHGAAGVLFAIGLFVTPQPLSSFWLWELTPLTARALSAWFISFGALALISAMEQDWNQLRVTFMGFLVSASFGLIALLRYSGQATLWGLAGAGYVLYLLVMLGVGAYGWRKSVRME